MKTYYEIAQGKPYRELTSEEKVAIRDRQNFLVSEYQNGNTEVFEELYDSLKRFIKSRAYTATKFNYGLELEDAIGSLNLVLVESVNNYNPEINDNFQAYFAKNLEYGTLMMGRRHKNDSHRKCSHNACQLDRSVDGETTIQEVVADTKDTISDSFARIVADQLLDTCFGENQKKRTAVLMYLDGFRQREIAEALATDGEKIESVYRNVKRSIAMFRQQAMKLS